MAAELTVDAELNMPAELPCPDSSRVCTNAGSRPAVAGSLPAPVALAVVNVANKYPGKTFPVVMLLLIFVKEALRRVASN